jgi:hypothetical protein
VPATAQDALRIRREASTNKAAARAMIAHGGMGASVPAAGGAEQVCAVSTPVVQDVAAPDRIKPVLQAN